MDPTVYETALKLITFNSSSENPDTTDRTISVSFNNGTVDSNTAISTIHVVAVNDPPVADDEGPITVAPGTTVNVNVVAGDTDADTDPLTVTGIIDPANPGVVIAIGGSNPSTVTLASGTTVTLRPDGTLDVAVAPGNSNSETFEYEVSDPSGATDTATVTLVRDTDADGIADNVDIDDDNDGILDVREQVGTNSVSTIIYLNDQNNNLIKVTDPNGTPVTTVIGSTGHVFGDIAMSSTGVLYGVDAFDRSVYTIDRTTAAATLVGTLPAAINFPNSLSFDNLGNLYVGDGDFGDDPRVWRFSPGNPAGATVWHTFPSGNASGDFIFFGDKAYIAWSDTTGNNVLRDVGLDASNNVVSDTVLGVLPADTFGLTADGEGNVYAVGNAGSGSHGLYRLTIPNAPISSGTGAIAVTAVPGTVLSSGQYYGATSSVESVVGFDRDTDADGLADHLDIDADNDGITDNIEAQTTDDFIAPSGAGAAMIDTNSDGLDDNYDNTTAAGIASGATGIGLTPVNTDGAAAVGADTTPDYLDMDSDGDGNNDFAENGLAVSFPSPLQGDADHDGLKDAYETAIDGNANDGFVVNEGITNPAEPYNNNGYLPDDGDAVDGFIVPMSADLNYRDAVLDNLPPAPVDPVPGDPTTPEIDPGNPANLLVPATDGVAMTLVALDYYSDPNSDPVTITPDMTGVPSWHTYDAGTQTFSGMPPADNTGAIVVPVTVSDGNGGSIDATITFQISNPAPTANPEATNTAYGIAVEVPLAGNDSDPDSDPLTVTSATLANPADGTLSQDPTTLVWTFTPALGFTGTAVINYSIEDQDGATSSSTHDVVVAANQVPVADDSVITVDEESTETPLGLAAPTDPDSDPLTITVTGLPSVGAVTLADGTPVIDGMTLSITQLTGLLYDAPADLAATATTAFTYTVSDGTAPAVAGSTAITVNPINDAPALDLSGGTAGSGFINTFTEDGAPVHITDVDAALTDIDSPTLTSVTVVLTNAKPGDAVVATLAHASITYNTDTSIPGQITYTMTGNISTADYQDLIRSLVFSNSSENPDTAQRIITITASDGDIIGNGDVDGQCCASQRCAGDRRRHAGLHRCQQQRTIRCGRGLGVVRQRLAVGGCRIHAACGCSGRNRSRRRPHRARHRRQRQRIPPARSTAPASLPRAQAAPAPFS